MMSYLSPVTTVELTCAAIGFFCLQTRKDLQVTLLWAYVLLVFLAELTGIYIGKQYKFNTWFYNLLLLVQVAFFFTMFKKIFDRYVKSWPIIAIGLAIVLLLYGYDLFSHGLYLRHLLTHTVFGLLMVGYSLYFFYLLLVSEEYTELKSNAIFWWVAGTLFFYFPVSVINIFGTPLRKILLNPNDTLYTVFQVLNIILYTCWSYSFICKKWEVQK